MHRARIGHRKLNFRASMVVCAKIENYAILEKFENWENLGIFSYMTSIVTWRPHGGDMVVIWKWWHGLPWW
jgi:hypothetical protein